MRQEVLRLLCSYANDNDFLLKSMDIKSAFVQTGVIEREIYMVPPKKANDDKHLWKLLKAAYGLIEGPIRWYLHSRNNLLQFGLKPSKVDPTLYFKHFKY